jgi:hypothetical protein
MHERRGDHYGSELRETDLAHAERVLREELQQRAGPYLRLRARAIGRNRLAPQSR